MTALGRIWFAVITTFVAATINFFLFRVMPGDAVSALRCRNCTLELHEALLTRYGLDKPLPAQYLTYLSGLARGDLGISLASGKPVLVAIVGPLLNTLPMLIAGTVIALVLGVTSGVLSAWRRGTALDAASQWTGMACYAMPTQWIGLLLVSTWRRRPVCPRSGLPLRHWVCWGNPRGGRCSPTAPSI